MSLVSLASRARRALSVSVTTPSHTPPVALNEAGVVLIVAEPQFTAQRAPTARVFVPITSPSSGLLELSLSIDHAGFIARGLAADRAIASFFAARTIRPCLTTLCLDRDRRRPGASAAPFAAPT
jgi:hypothetical protein